MVTGEHAFIRAADPDDAPALHAFYGTPLPCSALLDVRREPVLATSEELRETLDHKDAMRGVFHAVEDKAGRIRGFCGLRGVNNEAAFGEVMFMLLDEADYALPLAREAMEFTARLGFERQRLHKLTAHCLEAESALRAFLMDFGFVSEGVQREVLFTQGKYHNIEVLAFFPPAGAECQPGV